MLEIRRIDDHEHVQGEVPRAAVVRSDIDVECQRPAGRRADVDDEEDSVGPHCRPCGVRDRSADDHCVVRGAERDDYVLALTEPDVPESRLDLDSLARVSLPVAVAGDLVGYPRAALLEDWRNLDGDIAGELPRETTGRRDIYRKRNIPDGVWGDVDDEADVARFARKPRGVVNLPVNYGYARLRA